jgi:hypothetical protein
VVPRVSQSAVSFEMRANAGRSWRSVDTTGIGVGLFKNCNPAVNKGAPRCRQTVILRRSRGGSQWIGRGAGRGNSGTMARNEEKANVRSRPEPRSSADPPVSPPFTFLGHCNNRGSSAHRTSEVSHRLVARRESHGRDATSEYASSEGGLAPVGPPLHDGPG